MSVIPVDFRSRSRSRRDDDTPTVVYKAEHTDWCQPSECEIGWDGGVVHRRLIGKVSDVRVTVECNDTRGPNWELYRSSVEVYVSGAGEVGLTGEQVPILARHLVDANAFVANLGAACAVS